MLLLSAALAVAPGGCWQSLRQRFAPAPRVLPTTPTLADVMNVVNDNTARVRSLYTTDATLSAPTTPTLRANLALERPRKFRLRAETGLTGPELDVGSNEGLFWFWVKRNQPPAIFFCRHEQYYASAARQVVPVEPEWLIDALGLVTFDPAGQHSGPVPLRGGRLEIRTQLARADGPLTRITILDAARGWVLEQHLYDARGGRVASALASQHAQDAATGAILPRHIEIQWPATQFSMKLDFKSLAVNQLSPEPGELFEAPTYQGYEPIDLGDPGLQLGPPPAQPQPAFSPSPVAQRPALVY